MMESIPEGRFEEFFIVWESSCRNFIEKFKFATMEAQLSRLRIHVFLRSDTPKDAMPPAKDWIETHFCLTTCPYASDTNIVAYLLERFMDSGFEDRDSLTTYGNMPNTPATIFLVTDRERKYEEVIALLKFKDHRLRIFEVDGSAQSILDVLDSACKYCKLVFYTEQAAAAHIHELHNYFCNNPGCYTKSKRFVTEEELQKHIKKQTYCPHCEKVVFCSKMERRFHLRDTHDVLETFEPRDVKLLNCQFCPEKKFTSAEQREIHMKNCHKKCNCSCGEYFKTRDGYLDHFYSAYPLACFENRKCPHRFQSVAYQSLHHKDDHFSTHPFYCVPCQQRLTDTGHRQKICFKDEKALRIHGMSMGHNEEEMYLTDYKESLMVDTPLQRRAPSRTCSAINYC